MSNTGLDAHFCFSGEDLDGLGPSSVANRSLGAILRSKAVDVGATSASAPSVGAVAHLPRPSLAVCGPDDALSARNILCVNWRNGPGRVCSATARASAAPIVSCERVCQHARRS